MLRRLLGRVRYHAQHGDHWFLLALMGLVVLLAGAVLLY